MPKPYQRSRSRRIIRKRTPGGRLVTYYRKKLGDYPHCPICGRKLQGLPRAKEMKKLNLSKKRVTRMYSDLCPECSRKMIRKRIFSLKKEIKSKR